MSRRLRLAVGAFLALLALVSGIAVTGAPRGWAAADQTPTFAVQPSGKSGPDKRVRFDYQVAPGTTITDHVSVLNYSKSPVTLRVYAADATADYGTGSFTLIGADRASTDLGAWTSVGGAKSACPAGSGAEQAACAAKLGRTVTVGAGKLVTLPFTVAVPRNATPGDHSAGIVAGLRIASKTVTTEQRVGARVYVRVKGKLRPHLTASGVVGGFTGTANPVGRGTASIGFDLANTGNVRLNATPYVHLTGPFGIEIGTARLAEMRDLVPGATTHVQAVFPRTPPLFLVFSDLTVRAAPAEGGRLNVPDTTAHARAFALPWPALGIVVVVAGAVAGALWWRGRRRAQLARALAAYTQQVRAEAQGGPGAAEARPNESEA